MVAPAGQQGSAAEDPDDSPAPLAIGVMSLPPPPPHCAWHCCVPHTTVAACPPASPMPPDGVPQKPPVEVQPLQSVQTVSQLWPSRSIATTGAAVVELHVRIPQGCLGQPSSFVSSEATYSHPSSGAMQLATGHPVVHVRMPQTCLGQPSSFSSSEATYSQPSRAGMHIAAGHGAVGTATHWSAARHARDPASHSGLSVGHSHLATHMLLHMGVGLAQVLVQLLPQLFHAWPFVHAHVRMPQGCLGQPSSFVSSEVTYSHPSSGAMQLG